MAPNRSAYGGAARTVLIARDDRASGRVDSNLIEAATVEVLRACACAAETVLIPASVSLLSFAAIIAHDLRQVPRLDDEERPIPFGRFVPIGWGGGRVNDVLRPFLLTDLGGDAGVPAGGHDVLSVREAFEAHPPDAVVALTSDEVTLRLLESLDSRPPVWYFASLIGSGAPYFSERLKDRPRFIDLEERMPQFDDRDEESGRSDDEGLEPFIPFGVLLQDALWEPPEPR